MALSNPVVEQLRATIERTKGVQASAVVAFNGLAAKIQAAIDKALENGATAVELQPLVDVHDSFAASTDELAAAVAANP